MTIWHLNPYFWQMPTFWLCPKHTHRLVPPTAGGLRHRDLHYVLRSFVDSMGAIKTLQYLDLVLVRAYSLLYRTARRLLLLYNTRYDTP